MELFIQEPQLQFEKVASTQLDEDSQTWARQVITELFRQVPETSEYTPQVLFTQVDDEQGFGLGVVAITSATESALSAVRPGASAVKAYVPVVVKNHTLCPLDLLMTRTGKMMPLNGHRLRQALFRPDTFEMVTDDWGDTTLYNMFYPPGRSDNDFGAGISQGVGGGTQGAVTMIQGPGMKLSSEGSSYEMLDALQPSLLAADIKKLAGTLEGTPGLEQAVCGNEVFLHALAKIARAEGSTGVVTDMYEAALGAAPVDVVQMGYSDENGAYWVKTASRGAFYHRSPQFMSRGEFLKYAGEEVTQKVDTSGTVTVAASDSEADNEGPDQSKWSVVEDPGIYKVKTTAGKELTGWVLPDLVDLDGTKVPMAVFTNGSQGMVQDTIVGARVATGVDLPSSPAKGAGVFYCAGQGGVVATTPVVVVGMEGEMSGGNSYLVKSLTGEETRVRLVPGLKTLIAAGGEFHMPDTAKFLSLEDEGMVGLCSTVDELTKTSAYLLEPRVTMYGGDSQRCSVRFENLPKLAAMFPTNQDYETAVFALCLAGCSPQDAYTKVAQVERGATVSVDGLADVRLARDLISEARKTAADRSAEVLELRQHAVKEAAALPDVLSVDAVLSLGFINSENVRMFVNRIPYLEKALSHVCEMVLASRLGMTEIPEFAAARCVRALDDSIQGLKALSLREVDEGATRKR